MHFTRCLCLLLASQLLASCGRDRLGDDPPSNPQQPQAAPINTWVVFTVDRGRREHRQTGELLAQQEVRATFFVSPTEVGASGRLSADDLARLAELGHEIGALPASPIDLSTTTEEDAARQICAEREILTDLGLDARAFAYPRGTRDPSLESLVAGCGYTAARGIGGLRSTATCIDCPLAEPAPVQNRFALRSTPSIAGASLEDLTRYVTDAEAENRSILIFVLDRVCAECGPSGLTPELLTQFLEWLAERRARGTAVLPLGEAVSSAGALPPPHLEPVGEQLLQNASLEADSAGDGVPDCWREGGFGDNDFVSERVADAREGAYGHRVAITRYGDGARRLVVTCAPSAEVGDVFRASGWYRSNVPVFYTAYLVRGAELIWWTQSSTFPPSAGYRRATWFIPPIPEDVDGISFGLSIAEVGELTVDDFELRRVSFDGEVPPEQ